MPMQKASSIDEAFFEQFIDIDDYLFITGSAAAVNKTSVDELSAVSAES